MSDTRDASEDETVGPDPDDLTTAANAAAPSSSADFSHAGADPSPASSPARIGRYIITRVLGEGGMGTVYEAEQESPRRTVALKVVRAGHLGPEMLRRFERESRVLGKLQHPGIAQVFEAGTVTDDRGDEVPFFAMEFIRGVPLNEFAEQHALGTRDRLDLIARICDAVYHAHQKGVIHRDLKPANIIVDESGQPKILDFGVARATDSDIHQTTLQTDIGQLIGTVPYMSPEQVSGDPDELDTRSDVYALGILAYELLTRRMPYDLQRKMIHEAARIIREDEPTRLSVVDRTLRGDVETIVGKALEKEKARRYQSAESLSSDIRRYLHDEPISARPASTWYQVQKFSRRHTGLVVGAGIAVVLLVAGLVGTSYGLGQALDARNLEAAARAEADQQRDAAIIARDAATEQRRIAEAERDKAQRVADFMADTLGGAGPSVALGRDITMLKEMLDAAADTIGQGALAEAPEAELNLRGTIGTTYLDLARYVEAERMLAPTIELAGRLHPADHENRATALARVADLHQRSGELESAETRQREALAMFRRLHPDGDRDLAAAMVALAAILFDAGGLAEAEELLRDAITIQQDVLPPDSPDLAVTYGNLASIVAVRGDAVEAERLTRELVDHWRQRISGDHPELATALNGLAERRRSLGDLDGAIEASRESLAMCRRLHPDDHPMIATVLSNLATLEQAAGDLEGAEARLREAVEIRRRLLPGDHPDLALAIHNLGSLLQTRGRYDEAGPLHREAVAMWRATIPGDHRFVADGLVGLALCLRLEGDLDESVARYGEALAMWRRLEPAGCEDRLRTLDHLGNLQLYDRREAAQAETLYREAVEVSRRLHPDGHESTCELLGSLALSVAQTGDLEAATDLYRDWFALVERVDPPDSPMMTTSLNNAAHLLLAAGDAVAAEAPARRGVDVALRREGPASWRTAGMHQKLAQSLWRQDRFEAAHDAFLEADRSYRAAPSVPAGRHAGCMESMIEFFDAWHAVDPDGGHDARAAEWRTRRADLESGTAPGSS